MIKSKIKKLIEDTMDAVGMDVEIRHEPCGINMSYNFILHYVGFDAKRIQTAIGEVKPPVTLEQYVQTFTLHELGHAMDREALLDSLPRTMESYEIKHTCSKKELFSNRNALAMLLEEHEMNLQFEKTAWKNAEKLNRMYGLVDWAIFEQMKQQGLITYKLVYEKDLLRHEQLLQQAEKIAY